MKGLLSRFKTQTPRNKAILEHWGRKYSLMPNGKHIQGTVKEIIAQKKSPYSDKEIKELYTFPSRREYDEFEEWSELILFVGIADIIATAQFYEGMLYIQAFCDQSKKFKIPKDIYIFSEAKRFETPDLVEKITTCFFNFFTHIGTARMLNELFDDACDIDAEPLINKMFSIDAKLYKTIGISFPLMHDIYEARRDLIKESILLLFLFLTQNLDKYGYIYTNNELEMMAKKALLPLENAYYSTLTSDK